MTKLISYFNLIIDLASTRNPTNLGKYITTFSIIFTTVIDWVLYKLGKIFYTEAYVSKTDTKGTYNVTYFISGVEYKMTVKPLRGPSKISVIISDGYDVTSKVMPYIGPMRDFHGGTFTPEHAGLENMTIIFTDDTKKTWESRQLVRLPN
jgi:hypothetical protein